MGFFNNFLSNLGQGLLQPKGNLGDFRHAANLYTKDFYRLAPKTKFLYHVVFNFNPVVINRTSFQQKHQTTAGLLVKTVDLPKFKISTEVLQQYNRKKQIQTRLDYDTINIVFHDDNLGISTQLWNLYYKYHWADSNHGSAATGRSAGAYNSRSTYKGPYLNSFNYGLANNSNEPFFTSIQIFQLSRHQYQAFTLVNPIISAWQHDSLDNSDGATTLQNTMAINYESVYYNTGSVSEGDPAGFAGEYYDKTPSPLTLLGGGTSSLFGQGGILAGASSVFGDIANGNISLGTLIRGANVIRNTRGLSKAGLRNEGFSILKSALAATAVTAVSGVANIVFPKSGGNGQNNTTQATSYRGNR